MAAVFYQVAAICYPSVPGLLIRWMFSCRPGEGWDPHPSATRAPEKRVPAFAGTTMEG
jgi:hypothetical protein